MSVPELGAALRRLLLSTIEARESVLAHAAEAREVLRLLEGQLPDDTEDAEATSHLRLLHAAIDRAEASKTAALEEESVAAEAKLVALETAAVSSDGIAVGETSGATTLDSRLALVPPEAVEPLVLRVVVLAPDTATPHDRCLSAQLVAPPALRPGDVAVRLPSTRAVVGRVAKLVELSVSAVCAGRPADELAEWVLFLQRNLRAAVALAPVDGSRGAPLKVAFVRVETAEGNGSCMVACCVDVPDSAPVGSCIELSGLWLAGAPLPLPVDALSLAARSLATVPSHATDSVLRIFVCVGGLQPPLTLTGAFGRRLISAGNWHSPCVTADGTVFIPEVWWLPLQNPRTTGAPTPTPTPSPGSIARRACLFCVGRGSARPCTGSSGSLLPQYASSCFRRGGKRPLPGRRRVSRRARRC